ncbi:MAG: YchJ family metal-binding protein [Proteobacteria bacterium]|nr:YchJ family metal-binding protein [Pseudomonadota bacterium]
MKVAIKDTPCPCDSNTTYVRCCGRYLDGNETAGTAEALMRSRYSAYVLLRESYLLATWHPSTRPSALDVDSARTKWIGLQVLRNEQQDEAGATIEFIARYKVNGHAQRLHETSRFVREGAQWFYVGGNFKSASVDAEDSTITA